MDTIVAIIKDDSVLTSIVFAHDPSSEEITQFVELLGGTSGRKLEEKEIVENNQIVERVKPYPSWVWNSEIRNYEAPIKNNDPKLNFWNEETMAWESDY